MANQFEIYKCELCGNVIEVLFAGSGGFPAVASP